MDFVKGMNKGIYSNTIKGKEGKPDFQVHKLQIVDETKDGKTYVRDIIVSDKYLDEVKKLPEGIIEVPVYNIVKVYKDRGYLNTIYAG